MREAGWEGRGVDWDGGEDVAPDEGGRLGRLGRGLGWGSGRCAPALSSQPPPGGVEPPHSGGRNSGSQSHWACQPSQKLRSRKLLSASTPMGRLQVFFRLR